MNLPRLLVIADAETGGGRLPSIVAEAVHYGARAFVLRARRLPAPARAELGTALRRLLEPVGGVLITAGGGTASDSTEGARTEGGSTEGGATGGGGTGGGATGGGGTGGGADDAVHLAAAEPFPQPRPTLIGRSCHNADEVAMALSEGCDYVTVSPVYPTASKPGYGPALGPAGLAALCRPGLPVYGLGGVMPESVAECLDAGAYGVAVMGPILRSPSLVPDYLKELPA